MPLKQCAHPGCYKLQAEARCPEHKYKQTRTAEQRDEFYNKPAWRRFAKAKLEAEPLCRECEKRGYVRPSTQADHILPRQTHPELEWEWENIQGICRPCHARKTRREASSVRT